MLTIILLVVLSILLCIYTKRDSRLPPGPIKLPFVGSLLSVNPFSPRNSFRKLAERYGPALTFYYGNNPVVLINDAELARKICKTQAASGKCIQERGHSPYRNNPDMSKIFMKYQDMTAIKQFLLNLKPNLLEENVAMQLKKLHKKMGNQDFNSVTLRNNFDWLFYEIAWALISDYYMPEGAVAKGLLQIQIDRARDNWIVYCLDFFPINFGYIIAEWVSGCRRNVLLQEFILIFIKTIIETHHTNTLNHKWEAQDESFMSIIPKSDESTSHNGTSSDHEIVNSMVVQSIKLFSGCGALSSAARFCIQNLAFYPEWQDRLQMEIDSVLEPTKDISLEYMERMPLTVAFLKETLRLANVVPYGVHRCATEDINMDNYMIPKDTIVLINVDYINRSNYEESTTFNPKRFLSDGKTLGDDKNDFFSFSFGTRKCLGSEVAMQQLFLVFSSMVRNYHFYVAEGSKMPRSKMGVVVQPENKDLRWKDRNKDIKAI